MKINMGRHSDESDQVSDTHVNEHGGKQSRLKTRFDLLPPTAMRRVAEVYATGAAKYGEDNWRKISVKEHLAHALAHIYQYLEDEVDGVESDVEDHIVNAACRALMAIEIRDCGMDIKSEPGVHTEDDGHAFRASPWTELGRGMWMAPVGTPEPPPLEPVQDRVNIVRDHVAEVQREVQVNWKGRSSG